MDDQSIEQEIQAKGLTAPRVTPADIEANIADEYYFTAGEGVSGTRPGQPSVYRKELGLLTFCVLVLQNGYTITGQSACASPENFDADLGKKIARQDAVRQVWPLMGYELRSRLHRDAKALAAMPIGSEGMGSYTGTKQVLAKPMTRGAYNAYRDWTIPPNEDATEPGYLVEYTDGGKPNDSRHAGYISWSPADVFERSYRRLA